MFRCEILLDKPVYIGQAVLDLSKFIMYDLYFNKLKAYENRFQCQINLMGGDTDSFFLECNNISLRNTLLPAMKQLKLSCQALNKVTRYSLSLKLDFIKSMCCPTVRMCDLGQTLSMLNLHFQYVNTCKTTTLQ
jgi:hypothetical protein